MAAMGFNMRSAAAAAVLDRPTMSMITQSPSVREGREPWYCVQVEWRAPVHLKVQLILHQYTDETVQWQCEAQFQYPRLGECRYPLPAALDRMRNWLGHVLSGEDDEPALRALFSDWQNVKLPLNRDDGQPQPHYWGGYWQMATLALLSGATWVDSDTLLDPELKDEPKLRSAVRVRRTGAPAATALRQARDLTARVLTSGVLPQKEVPLVSLGTDEHGQGSVILKYDKVYLVLRGDHAPSALVRNGESREIKAGAELNLIATLFIQSLREQRKKQREEKK
jgi:hypothetical protein